MSQSARVVVVMSRCRTNGQGFGIRLEERTTDRWTADWAFAIKESLARREGYDQNEIEGSFEVVPGYPGCPHCEAASFFRCHCGRVACWDGEHNVKCPWCRSMCQVTGEIKRLDVEADR